MAISASFRQRFGRFSLDAACTLPEAGISVLFGPSGCGKTTMLRCFAGLIQPEQGSLSIGDETWQADRYFRPTSQRAVGYVFQEPSLFPHLSVEANLRFGLKRAKPTSNAVGFDNIVAMLALAPLLHRSPWSLSGGEQQRVAIGRALLTHPRLLLMDEPLSALDRASKDEILPYLELLHETLALPMIYVTHDLNEMLRLADHLVLLDDGKVVAAGPLADLLARLDLPLARSVDAASILQGVVSSYDSVFGLAMLDIKGGVLQMPGAASTTGMPVRVRIVASDVTLSRTQPADTTILNILPVQIVAAESFGHYQMNVLLRLGGEEGERLVARVTLKSWTGLNFQPGEMIFAMIKAVSLVG